MINRLIESKISFAVTFCAFVLTLGWNASQGTGLFLPGHGQLLDSTVLVAHGPSIPPDPWEGDAAIVAHGPSIPPDPWEGDAAIVAHGPSIPPDPWEGLLVASRRVA